MDQPTRIATLVTLALAAGSAAAEELTPIRVEATDPPRRMSLAPEATAADGGEALREQPGVDAIRMGGHGIDPVIRGQSGNRLNVLLGDGYAFGGCPNRMDPPSAYASPGLYDEMVVEKGVTGVTAGAGGPGGTVRFQRTAPAVSDDRPVTGRVGASGGTNGVPLAGHADVAVGSDDGYLRLLGEHKDADSYEDGNGDEVHSAWRSRTMGAVAGWTPDEETGLEVTVEENRQDHVLYAGSRMDVPESTREHAGLSGHWAAAGLKWEASLNASDVDHLMDNYSYRDAATRMATPTDARTRDARIATTGRAAGGEWTIGVDALRVDRDASRLNKDQDLVQSRMWPDVRRQRAGAFGEWVGPAAGAEWTAGLRVDRMSAEARAADAAVAMNNTPSSLYADAYGTDTTDWDSTEVGGVVRGVWTVGRGGWIETGLSRSVRAPDATERFMASAGMGTMGDWIGNPDLEAEAHHQLDLGTGWRQGPWQARAALWYDAVSDYIDRYQGANDETLYGNYDATLYGTEWEAGYRPESGAGVRLTAWTTYGRNDDAERPLERIPPLKARLTADWQAPAWEVAAHLTAAGEQDRIHDATTGGQDPGETAGYAVLDLEGRWQMAERWHLTGGVRNALDRAYHQHLQTGNGFDMNVDAVNEPGRQAWLGMEVML
ncbi:MAG: TonB-dependent receptor domain-containing protein [Pseudomonadota bacterium]